MCDYFQSNGTIGIVDSVILNQHLTTLSIDEWHEIFKGINHDSRQKLTLLLPFNSNKRELIDVAKHTVRLRFNSHRNGTGQDI